MGESPESGPMKALMPAAPAQLVKPEKPKEAKTQKEHLASVKRPAVIIGGLAFGIAVGTIHAELTAFLAVYDKAITTAATVAIAAFTYTLWRATSKMQEATASTLEHLRREFNATHRPEVSLRRITFEAENSDTLARVSAVKIELANVGGTDAVIGDLNLTFRQFVTNGLVPWQALADLERKRVVEAYNQAVPHGGSYALRVNFSPESTDLFSAVAVQRGDDSVYAIGYVRYFDVNGQYARRTGFIRRCNMSDRRFERVADPDFEYAD